MKRILIAMFNIFVLLTAVIWVIPFAIWALHDDGELCAYLTGEVSIFDE